ncbi:iron-sulfur cluster assembly scaffold protein [Novosphingobium ginsenosidimutans]|uniref:Iron-sulfur cluster assembly scaffold protein n=1 Tax=Novosphingobium ginsenosidimutans TaxID=1176536 RepID=A0A5B8S936_9SPHN|nr:iron-sulfur cluster assembly scaffold protein [Novosphingobium ginsenosidimutans]QEA17087.1 iron-sulfur cluster assembly scaffold protein [Novosphingobium ginsenosidimutans]
MSSTTNLYTREVLALATSLSQWPHDPGLPLQGAVRSQTCGSAVTLGLAVGEAGAITGIGLKAQACAIGQASAALFAAQAIGHDENSLRTALREIRTWLNKGGDLPAWPGFATIAAARDYPARHGAITLAWQAALEALSSAPKPG